MTSHDRSKIDTSGLTQREKDIHRVLQRNELFGGKGADKISHAGTPNSGFSFGPQRRRQGQGGGHVQGALGRPRP